MNLISKDSGCFMGDILDWALVYKIKNLWH